MATVDDPADPTDTSEELELCSHCNKEVAKVNFPMHEAHCKRFLCLCPDCGDSVPKDQLEEHKEEQHAVVRCQMCDKKMERCKLSDHETNECQERSQSCEYCELDLPLSALKQHAVACGSRTERCPDCKRYVTLKDQAGHSQICSAALSEDDSSDSDESSNLDMNKKPSDNRQDDEKSGGFLSYDQSDYIPEELEEPLDMNFSFMSHQKKKGGGAAGFGDRDEIDTCPNCHLALPRTTLQWHKDKCKLFEILNSE